MHYPPAVYHTEISIYLLTRLLGDCCKTLAFLFWLKINFHIIIFCFASHHLLLGSKCFDRPALGFEKKKKRKNTSKRCLTAGYTLSTILHHVCLCHLQKVETLGPAVPHLCHHSACTLPSFTPPWASVQLQGFRSQSLTYISDFEVISHS